VTGGGRGIGREVATALAGAGAHIALTARSADELAATARLVEEAGGVAATAVADVTDAAGLAAAVADLRAQLGPIDVLVNNAGILGPIGPLWEVDADEWWATMDVNVRGSCCARSSCCPRWSPAAAAAYSSRACRRSGAVTSTCCARSH
jgi:NAD(P)-dependent dehydrogenase (short-subunit alcohol dehydrogenase family)